MNNENESNIPKIFIKDYKGYKIFFDPIGEYFNSNIDKGNYTGDYLAMKNFIDERIHFIQPLKSFDVIHIKGMSNSGQYYYRIDLYKTGRIIGTTTKNEFIIQFEGGVKEVIPHNYTDNFWIKTDKLTNELKKIEPVSLEIKDLRNRINSLVTEEANFYNCIQRETLLDYKNKITTKTKQL